MIENYENFSESQLKILSRYVTNTSSNVFVLRNLPEVIKGALFSRYSRSSLGLRSLLLKEFILGEDTAFPSILAGQEEEKPEDQLVAIKKAQNFYDRILDGYGDDSIGELGGAHLAVENISMIAAKVIEDARIGGSPLEKSTRYIYFDQKYDGNFLFHREPIIMMSAFRDLYLETCNQLFQTYSDLIPELTAVMEKAIEKDPAISPVAYTAALRAKVLDCLRGLLPASALTNVGIYGNGRFFETLTQKLHCHNLAELQELGRKGYQELSKVIPSFVRRAEQAHKHQKTFCKFLEQTQSSLKALAHKQTDFIEQVPSPIVRLISYDPDSPYRVAAALLFPYSQSSLLALQERMRRISEEELATILDAACQFRENRRHKSPRALEHATFTFEMVADFGIYRDLQRHRMLTQERQLLTCNFGFRTPPEIVGTPMEEKYIAAMEMAKKAYDKIAQEFPEEAQYVVPMAYNIHWYFHINLRALQWLCELRSSAAGHPTYRYVAQELANQVFQAVPAFKRFFSHVDFEGHLLGRLGQEVRNAQKKQSVEV